MFLNHFLTSIEQGSWIKSCVLQGIVFWTFKTTSEKHERARSLHRRRHHVFPSHGGIDTEVSQASSMATWHCFLCTRFGRQTSLNRLEHDHHGASYEYVCSVFLEWLAGWPVSLIIQDHQGCKKDWIGDCCLLEVRQPNKYAPLCWVLSPLLSPQRV